MKGISITRVFLPAIGLSLLLFSGIASAITEPEVDSIYVNGDIPVSESKLLSGTGLEVGASLLLITPEEVGEGVKHNLNALGYLYPSVEVEWPSWGEADGVVKLTVETGHLYVMSGLVIDGVSIFPGDSIASLYPVSPGEPITPADTASFCNSVIDAYSERGYIRAGCRVSIVNGGADSTGAEDSRLLVTLRCTVDEGAQYYLGEVTVSGLETIRPVVVTRELLISPGDALNEKLLQQSMRDIYQMGLFRDVRFTYQDNDSRQNTKNLIIEVTEADYHTVDIGCGYMSPEAVFFSASWTDPNIMDNEQKLKLSMYGMTYVGSDDGQKYQPVITYEEPWFLSTRWKLRLELDYLYYRIPGLDQRSWSVSTSFARTIWSNLHFTTGCKYEYEKFWESDDAGDLNTSDWQGTGSLDGAVVHDTRTPLLNPIRGHWYMFSTKVSGGILGGTDFYRIEAEVRKLVFLSDRFIIALRSRFGSAFTYGEDTSIPPDDRFFLGGGTTIRGYAYNSIGPSDADGNPTGGNDTVLGNLEIRAGIWRDLWIVLFCDAGGLWDTFSEIDVDAFAVGTGVGLRYDTPFGAVRLDYGFAPSRSNSIETGRFYIGLGQAF